MPEGLKAGGGVGGSTPNRTTAGERWGGLLAFEDWEHTPQLSMRPVHNLQARQQAPQTDPTLG